MTCSQPRSSKTSRAAAFWTRTSGANVICGKPAKTVVERVVMNASISRTVRSRPIRRRMIVNDNDNDKRLGLTAKADQPDHKKKIQYTKIKIDNEAVQKLHTS